MDNRVISQPANLLGNEISNLLDSGMIFSRIVFVSAFTALRTILRLRKRLLGQIEHGAEMRFVLGIDLGGTSREVLNEILSWGCETFLFHNKLTRATFHPKLYLFENAESATLFIGSNNLTDGGLYTNYETAIRYDFIFPEDSTEFRRLLEPLNMFLEPRGVTVRRLDANLLNILTTRGELPSESEARQNTRRRNRRQPLQIDQVPDNPFGAELIPLAPLLPEIMRQEERIETQVPVTPQLHYTASGTGHPQGVLVWRKKLTRSDALQVREGTAHVGGVRLTQARFENPPGQRIDQTTYFRGLFADYRWEHESGRHRTADQEHAFIPIHILIRGNDYGIHEFEISHKPSGEAGQNNYTTILRWGRDFNRIVSQENIADAVFSLYQTDDEDARFVINIED